VSRRLLFGVLALALVSVPAWGQDGGVGKPLPDPSNAVREVFGHKQYQFCHEPNYPLTPEEKHWCDLGAGENTQACPTFRQACKNDALAKQIKLHEPPSFTLPNLSLPVRLLLWILLGLGLGMLIFAVIRHFLDHKTKQDVIKTKATADVVDEAAAALARQVETDVQRLLERARAEAAAGDFRAAIGDAYAALLRRLEGTGIVHVRPDQTNGDYVHRVRKEQPMFAPRMSAVVDTVELAQFGEQVVTREHFDGVFSLVTKLLTERIGLSLVLAVLFLSGIACGIPRSSWDTSPSGRAGVIEYLGKRGFKVHERLLSVAKIDGAKADGKDESKKENTIEQLVLLPGAQLGNDEWQAVEKWALRGGRTLIVAGGRKELPAWIDIRIVEKQVSKPETITLGTEAAKRWGTLQVRIPEDNGLEPKPDSTIVLKRKQAPYAVEAKVGQVIQNPQKQNLEGEQVGEGEPDDESERADDDGEAAEDEIVEIDDVRSRVLVLADDLLFRNASLLIGDNALVLDHLLRDGGTSIELAGDLTGLVSSNPVQSVQRGRLGPAMLQLAAFLLIFFVCKGARFGRPIQTQRIERREYAEHVRALGLHYARSRSERHALGFIGSYAVERLRERFGLHVDRSLSGLAEAVATRTGRSVGEVMRLLLEARDASKAVPAEKGARDLDTAAELCKLLEETGGTGGHKRI
jgi:hypothetical protein